MRKTFICLAKSARDNNLCIAGKELNPDGTLGSWFRPIGRVDEAVPASECAFDMLDIVSCEVERHKPSSTQPENYILSSKPGWTVDGSFPMKKIATLCDNPPELWSTGADCSSYHGSNDKVAEEIAEKHNNSLFFVSLSSATIRKNDESWDSPKHKLRFTFKYNQTNYTIAATDLVLSNLFWNTLAVGESAQLGKCYVTVSLAQPFQGYCYKLVAGYVEA